MVIRKVPRRGSLPRSLLVGALVGTMLASMTSFVQARSAPVIESFELIDAESDTVLGTVQNGDVINLAEHGHQVSLRAVGNRTTKSVIFFISGDGSLHTVTDSQEPFSVAGGDRGDYEPWDVQPGPYVVTAVPFSHPHHRGTPGSGSTIEITIVDQQPDPTIENVTLVNADTDTDVKVIGDGEVIDLAETGPNITLRADANASTESVGFVVNGELIRTEDLEPYAIAGDVAGDYVPWSPAPGDYEVEVVPYPEDGSGGAPGLAMSVELSVVDTTPTPDPTPEPDPTPPPAGSVCDGGLGAEYYVDPGGSDVSGDGSAGDPWATPDHALSQMPAAGDATIWVAPGVYDDRVEVQTEFASQVRLVSSSPYRARLTHSQNPVVRVLSERLCVSGFEIVGQPTSNNGGNGVVYFQKAHRSVLENSVVHDDYDPDGDLVRVLRSDDVVLAGNMFYNAGSNESWIDINGGSQRTIVEDNFFFDDYAGSGRNIPSPRPAMGIVIKTSNTETAVTAGTIIRRNIFTHRENQRPYSGLIQAGSGNENGRPGAHAANVTIENNLFHMQSSAGEEHQPIRVQGADGVKIIGNTIVGDMMQDEYLARATWDDPSDFPANNVEWRGNIFSSPDGAMSDRLINSELTETTGGIIDTNLYYNGGSTIPTNTNDRFDITQDANAVQADPAIPQLPVTLPRWNGNDFAGGHTTIRAAFIDYITTHATPAPTSPAANIGYPNAPSHDILGNPRTGTPDLGAIEFNP